MEVALNLPFESEEIKDIAVAEFRKRLDGLSPLQGAKEYASFSLSFDVKIKVARVGAEATPKETLAWGNVEGFRSVGLVQLVPEEAAIAGDTYQAGEPNEERQMRDMPLTIESTDGKGGKARRKVRVKA